MHLDRRQLRVLTLIIDDWRRGDDPRWLPPYISDFKERFWHSVSMLAAKCMCSMPSLLVIRIAIKDKSYHVSAASASTTQAALFPISNYLQSRPRGCANDLDPKNTMNKGFKLEQCKEAHRYTSAFGSAFGKPQVAVARVGCYVYGRGPTWKGALWNIEEVNALWPRTDLQSGSWSWTQETDVDPLGGS